MACDHPPICRGLRHTDGTHSAGARDANLDALLTEAVLLLGEGNNKHHDPMREEDASTCPVKGGTRDIHDKERRRQHPLDLSWRWACFAERTATPSATLDMREACGKGEHEAFAPGGKPRAL